MRGKNFNVMIWVLVIIPAVMCCSGLEGQKNYYFPDPHAGTAPTGSFITPPSPGSFGTTPSNSGGSHGIFPPSNCGGSPPSGRHHHKPTQTSPSSDSGGVGHTHTPPISGGSTPSSPIIFTPPTAPIVIPGISVPSPPYAIDPNSPPFSCNYWRAHPTLMWGLLGWAGTMGQAFNLTSIPTIPTTSAGLGSTTTLKQALADVRTDGYGALYRQGTAALLNSMIDHSFPFTTTQVQDKFLSAIKSNKAASAQARVFKLANEGHLNN